MSDLHEWLVWEEGADKPTRDDKRYRGFIAQHAIEKFCESCEDDGDGGFACGSTLSICAQLYLSDDPTSEPPIHKFDVYVTKSYEMVEAKDSDESP